MQRTLHPVTFILCMGLLGTASAQPDSWTVKADFGGNPRANAIGFGIGTKGYMGTGSDLFLGQPHTEMDFWEYDPATNTWTPKADFGGGARGGAVAFSISGKGYVCTGYNANGGTNDLWEYDPATDTWTQKADFGGVPRSYAVGFSVGNKGYVGLGSDDNFDPLADFWEYDPAMDTWTQKADFAGGARAFATGFGMGTLGYVGLGNDGTNDEQDFWAYDPVADNWTQKAVFPAAPRSAAVGFSIGNRGLISTGRDASTTYFDLWQYDAVSDTWAQKANFSGASRGSATGFAVGGIGYVGLGRFTMLQLLQDFRAYTPDLQTGIDDPQAEAAALDLAPVPTADVVRFTAPAAADVDVRDATGRTVLHEQVLRGGVQLDLSTLPAGAYAVSLRTAALTERGWCVKE